MANKKTKLTLSGIAKKSIQNIELAKTQSKNTVVIEKKPNRFSNKGSFSRSTGPRPQKKPGFRSNDLLHQDLQLFQNLRLQLLIILKSVN